MNLDILSKITLTHAEEELYNMGKNVLQIIHDKIDQIISDPALRRKRKMASAKFATIKYLHEHVTNPQNKPVRDANGLTHYYNSDESNPETYHGPTHIHPTKDNTLIDAKNKAIFVSSIYYK